MVRAITATEAESTMTGCIRSTECSVYLIAIRLQQQRNVRRIISASRASLTDEMCISSFRAASGGGGHAAAAAACSIRRHCGILQQVIMPYLHSVALPINYIGIDAGVSRLVTKFKYLRYILVRL